MELGIFMLGFPSLHFDPSFPCCVTAHALQILPAEDPRCAETVSEKLLMWVGFLRWKPNWQQALFLWDRCLLLTHRRKEKNT